MTSIGDSAFYRCLSLTSITLPEGVTSIADEAFVSCESLTNINISSGVQSIGNIAFFNCYDLATITVDPSNTEYSLQNGMLLGSNGTELIVAEKDLTNAVIPDGVITIADSAFAGADLLSVTIPDSVRTIGFGAFYRCIALTSVDIPDGVEEIDVQAFWGCTALESVTIPESVTSIAESAFHDCSSLASATVARGSAADEYFQINRPSITLTYINDADTDTDDTDTDTDPTPEPTPSEPSPSYDAPPPPTPPAVPADLTPEAPADTGFTAPNGVKSTVTETPDGGVKVEAGINESGAVNAQATVAAVSEAAQIAKENGESSFILQIPDNSKGLSKNTVQQLLEAADGLDITLELTAVVDGEVVGGVTLPLTSTTGQILTEIRFDSKRTAQTEEYVKDNFNAEVLGSFETAQKGGWGEKAATLSVGLDKLDFKAENGTKLKALIYDTKTKEWFEEEAEIIDGNVVIITKRSGLVTIVK